MSKKAAREFIQTIVSRYDRRFLETDPVAFAHRYEDPKDQEIVALISALLSFGNAKAIVASLSKIIHLLGPKPSDTVYRLDRSVLETMDRLEHRWIKGQDLVTLLRALKKIVRRHGSLEKMFLDGYSPQDPDVAPALEKFCEKMKNPPISPYFFPSPAGGSACKRLNMFLRWMIRPADGVDLGLWKMIPPSKLIIPLDTHLYQFARKFKITRRKSPDWKTAREITDFLKEIDPEDPVKFDFAICHYGMEVGF